MSNKQVFYAEWLSHGVRPVNLLNGFGYWGGKTPAVVYSKGFKLFDFNTTVLMFKMKGIVDGSFFAGMGGPGWATQQYQCKYEVIPTAESSLVLHASAPFSQAGFLIGSAVEVAMTITVEEKKIKIKGKPWKPKIVTEWKSIFSGTVALTLDILNLIINAILSQMQKNKSGDAKQEPKSGSPKYYGWYFFDQSFDYIPSIYDNGKLTISPAFAVQIDLASYVAALRGLNTALGKIGGGLSFGPLFGLAFPVHIQVKGIAVDDAVFELWKGGKKESYDSNFGMSYNGTLTRYKGTYPGNNFGNTSYAFTPSRCGMQFTWSWGLDIRVGVWICLALCYGVMFTPSIGFNLLSLLGVKTDLQSGVTETLYTKDVKQGYLAQHMTPYEVVFDLPDPAAV